jgi:peptidoglycan/LPS O-acetylase OafA/YrhL
MSSPQAGSASRLPALTGARFVAAAVVFANHSGLESVFRNDTVNFWLTGLTASAAEGAVTFFFLLSGFVLAWSAHPEGRDARPAGRGAFYRRRLVKIFPNHLVTWAAGLLLLLAAGGRAGPEVLPSLALTHAWIPQAGVLAGTNGPSWSLSCELLFYLAFPLLIGPLRRIRPDRLWWWAGGLAGAVALVPALSLLLPAEPTLFGSSLPFWRFWFVVLFPPLRLLDFLLGIVLARIVLAGRWPRVRWRLVLPLLSAAWLVALALPVPLGWVAPFVVPLGLVLGRLAVGGESGLLAQPIMVRLGEWSFAFYLVHWLVLHHGHLAFGGGSWPAPVALAFLSGAAAVSLGLSGLLYTCLETPCMRRFGGRARQTAPARWTAPIR